MENAAVEFLLENLKQLQLHHAHLISDDIKNQIQVLESNLCLFKQLLDDSTDQNRDEDKTLEEIVKEIIKVVYEAEDAVDAIVSQAAEKGIEKYFKRAFDASAELMSVIQKVELIGAKVKEVYDHKQIDFSTLQSKRESNPQKQQQMDLHENRVSTWREDYEMVGFYDEAETLILYLNEETEVLDVICIVGEAGLGKTALARHIFGQEDIAYEFPTRLWVYCSANFRRRDVYLAMLRDLNCITEDMYDKTDEEIAQTLHARLKREKFLIVFDDLWSTEVWDELRDVLPKSNTSSKILITSHNQEVSSYANRSREPHRLRYLNPEECWILLELIVFGKQHECPLDLKELGKWIAALCQGLPLLIMLTGGILAKTASAGEMHETWEKVYKGLEAHAYGEEMAAHVVSLSYNMLPCYLRPCFLYMGMFPEDFEISVQRLILLWIAEGFIQQKTGTTVSLEEIGMIGKVGLTERIKTCRLHDLIRDFCVSKAGEYFYHEIREIAKPWVSKLDMYCHISINSEVVSFLSSQPHGSHVRTFLHFLREETILLPENVSSIPDGFKVQTAQSFGRDAHQIPIPLNLSSSFEVHCPLQQLQGSS